MKTLLRAVVLVPVTALVLSACGGGDDADADPKKPYVDSLTTTWAQSPGVSKPEARCWSNKFVDTVGVERLQNIGTANQFAQTVVGLDYTALGLTRGEGEEVYDHFTTCGMDLLDSMIDAVAEAEELPAEARGCIADRVEDSEVREFMVTSMVGGSEAATEEVESVTSALLECAFGVDMQDLLDAENAEG